MKPVMGKHGGAAEVQMIMVINNKRPDSQQIYISIALLSSTDLHHFTSTAALAL